MSHVCNALHSAQLPLSSDSPVYMCGHLHTRTDVQRSWPGEVWSSGPACHGLLSTSFPTFGFGAYHCRLLLVYPERPPEYVGPRKPLAPALLREGAHEFPGLCQPCPAPNKQGDI